MQNLETRQGGQVRECRQCRTELVDATTEGRCVLPQLVSNRGCLDWSEATDLDVQGTLFAGWSGKSLEVGEGRSFVLRRLLLLPLLVVSGWRRDKKRCVDM